MDKIHLTFSQKIIVNVFRQVRIIKGNLVHQKYFFILKHEMQLSEFKYMIHDLGPYSYDLSGDVEYLLQNDILQKYDGQISVGNNILDKVDDIDLEEDEIEKKIAHISSFIQQLFDRTLVSEKNIELAGSILILLWDQEIYVKSEIWEKIKKWKPGFFSLIEFDSVWDILYHKKLISKEVYIPNNYIERLKCLNSGSKNAREYYRLIEKFFRYIFKNELNNFVLKEYWCDGNKKIDFSAENVAKKGIFKKMSKYSSSPINTIPILCKNQDRELFGSDLVESYELLNYEFSNIAFLTIRSFEHDQWILDEMTRFYRENDKKSIKKILFLLQDIDLIDMVEFRLRGIEPSGILKEKLRSVITNRNVVPCS
ncbi:hypothetical protein [Candidatus Lokiarchaeum ossiferum]|uniref:hypothetical protein n=1 Tax=Candidatus Lokiarchaeum ossiferum TaxID=2951803 RepID=UPI00352E61CE